MKGTREPREGAKTEAEKRHRSKRVPETELTRGL